MILQLNSSVFIWTNEDSGLIYDTESGREMEFVTTDSVRHIVSELLRIDNLYSVEIPNNCDESCRQWINEITSLGFGSLYQSRNDMDRVSLMPILKIQETTKHYQWQHEQHRDGRIIDNIHSVSVDFGSEYGCDLVSQQIQYPSEKSCRLDFTQLCVFLQQAMKSRCFSRIHLIGDVRRMHLSSLRDILHGTQLSFHLTYEDFAECCEYLESEFPHADIHVLIRSINIDAVPMERIRPNISFVFITEDEDSDELFNNWDQQHIKDICTVIPVFNGKNKDFVCRELCISREDLFERIITKRQIFIAQTLNVADFGRFYINPDGKVYTNRVMQPVGTLKDSPYTLTYKELTEGKAWFLTRNSIEPCCLCPYRQLCPSPSHFEQVLNCNTLCWKYIDIN